MISFKPPCPPQTILKEIDTFMLTFQNYLLGYLDSLMGHLILVSYLLAVTDEQAVWKRLKKLPPLLLSPWIASMGSLGLYLVIPEFGILRYGIFSVLILAMCTLWIMWAWQWDFWKAFSAVCMSGILQVATSALSQMVFRMLPSSLGEDRAAMAAMAGSLLFSIAAAALLKRIRFGAWFRLLLEDPSGLRRTAMLLFALEISMEAFLILQNGVQAQYLAAYYSLVVVLAVVILALMVYLARRSEDSRTLQAQRDIITQQQLYEQSLEDIRQEVRSFRHDYKNLLAGLGRQGEGGPDAPCPVAAELEEDFDRRLGEKIRLSVQIGNLRVPQVRSLLLSKLAEMQKKGVEYRLEVLYPVEAVAINVWDFVRCLGILVDNAMEAALDTERPWVEIVLLVQGGRMFLRVSNPYANSIDPEKIRGGGWSTKGAGRGTGLSGYQRILRDYPNAAACTSWENGVFVQELTVEDGS